MTMRKALICILLLGAACSQGGPSRQESPKPPNILLMIADDWSWPHAGAYGDRVVQTPTFDRLAAEGVLFSNAYVSSPSCTPSRAALLTGQWHWRLKESANLWSTLQADIPVYPDLLEAQGYHVGYSGKGWGPGQVEPGGRSRNPAGDQYKDFEAFWSKRGPDQPFCFWLGSTNPHRPYEEGIGAQSGIPLDEIVVNPAFPDDPVVRSDIADYYWEVQQFDLEAANVIAFLEQAGELDETLVVMTSDNGMPFPRAKASLYDAGVRVPLVIRWPGRAVGGRAVNDFVSLTDLGPTFLRAAGRPVPEVMTGRSLIQILESENSGRVDPQRDHVLVGKERHVPCQDAPISGGTPMRAIRNSEYLYIRNFEPDRWPAGTPNYESAFFPGAWFGDTDNGPTKSFMIENRGRSILDEQLYGAAFGKRPVEELYRISDDPGQMRNIAAEPAMQLVLDDLRAQLESELSQTGDPRVVGGAETLEAYPYYGGSPLHPDFKAQE